MQRVSATTPAALTPAALVVLTLALVLGACSDSSGEGPNGSADGDASAPVDGDAGGADGLTDADAGGNGDANGGGADDGGEVGPDTPPPDDGGGGSPDDADAGEGEPTGFPSQELSLKILEPGPRDFEAVIGGQVEVGGVLFGEADSLSWQSDSGGQGQMEVNRFWRTGPIELEEGSNVITVRATKGERTLTDRIHITYNPGFRFDAEPGARPDVVWVDESGDDEVVFTIPISLYPNFDEDSVELHEVDENGQNPTSLGAMKDNGAVSSIGDEIEGDGVFTRRVELSCDEPGRRYFRVSALVNGGAYEAFSPVVTVHCLEHVEQNTCESHQSILDDAKEEAEGDDPDVDAIVDSLESNAEVASAGRAAGEGFSVWVRFESGLLGAVNLAPEGYRGGVPSGGGASGGSSGAPGSATGTRTGGVANVTKLGSKQSIVLGPHADEFGEAGDAEEVAEVLEATECPPFDLTGEEAHTGGDASLSRFRSLSNFGIISISTHGDALFGGLDADMVREAYGWDHGGAQETLWSGEPVSCGSLLQEEESCTVSSDQPNGGCPEGTTCVATQGSGGSNASGSCIDRTQMDLRLGRVALTPEGYAMTPAFFDAHAGSGYPQSLVNLGACRTLYNGTLASTFYGRGARAVTGFTGYVDSQWARERVVGFFESVIGEGLVGQFHEVRESPSDSGTFWRLFGAGNLDLADQEIINADFEKGSPTGWRRNGDGRVISQLESTLPVSGKFMGLISTGLGFTTQTGEMTQEFCVPSDVSQVQIYWKYFSEEFKEFCGSQFQDTFQAVLEADQGKLPLVDVRIDDLCPYDTQGGDVSCSFGGGCEDPDPCDLRCMGSDGCYYEEGDEEGTGSCGGEYNCQCGRYFVGLSQSDVSFDQGGVFNTQWQKTVKDVSALAGERVKLRLFASDTGDSIYDTAVLIDDIEFR